MADKKSLIGVFVAGEDEPVASFRDADEAARYATGLRAQRNDSGQRRVEVAPYDSKPADLFPEPEPTPPNTAGVDLVMGEARTAASREALVNEAKGSVQKDADKEAKSAVKDADKAQAEAAKQAEKQA